MNTVYLHTIFFFVVYITSIHGFLLNNAHGNRRQQTDISTLLTKERQSRQQLEQYVNKLYEELTTTKELASNLTREYGKLKQLFTTDWRKISGCDPSRVNAEVPENQCCVDTQSMINNVLSLQDNVFGIMEQAVTNMEETKCKIDSSSWTSVFLACPGNGHSVIHSWDGTLSNVTTVNGPTPSDPIACSQRQVRSNIVDNWSTHNIDQVKLEYFKAGKSIAVFYFNGLGTTKMNWFSKENLIGTSFTDLKRTSKLNFFSIEGHALEERRFYINEAWLGCPHDVGWLLVRDVGGRVACHFDHLTTGPTFIVSPGNKKAEWEQGHYILADLMEISVQTNSCKCPSALTDGSTAIIG